MENKKELKNDSISFEIRLKNLQHRHELSVKGLSMYLGTPEKTVIKWLRGERIPGAATERLLNILEMIETINPELHEWLISEVHK